MILFCKQDLRNFWGDSMVDLLHAIGFLPMKCILSHIGCLESKCVLWLTRHRSELLNTHARPCDKMQTILDL